VFFGYYTPRSTPVPVVSLREILLEKDDGCEREEKGEQSISTVVEVAEM